MSKVVKNIILIIFGTIVLALAILAVILVAGPTPIIQSKTQNVTITSLPTVGITATTTPYIPKELPPTWTPTPKEAPSATAEIQTTPTLEPTRLTIQAGTAPFTLSGSGSINTRPFILPAGRTTISWKYSGGPSEESQVRYAYNTYKTETANYYNVYKIFYNLYTGMIQDALDRQDAFALADAKQILQRYTDEYNQNIANAKAKYDQALATYTSSFKVLLKRTPSEESSTLINAKGVYLGSSSFTSQTNITYYFYVQSSGMWEITITPPK